MGKQQRKRGGMVNLGDDPDQTREGGHLRVFTPNSKVAEAGQKTKSEGFARGGAKRAAGGAIAGSAPAGRGDRRARGGRTGSPFSAARSMSERDGSSSSGHEGE